MPNKNYINGRTFEYQVKKLFVKNGYEVLRTSGSHGIADLIAIDIKGNPHVTFIQCKYGKQISKNEKQRIYKFNKKLPFMTEIVIAHREHGKRVKFYYVMKELKLMEVVFFDEK